MKVQKIGYVRVSTIDQKVERQLEGMRLDKIFTDIASGKDAKRPQLEAMLCYAREGDSIVVHSMDRLARNVYDLRKIVEILNGRRVSIEFIKESLTFTGDDSPMAVFLLNIMGSFAELERSLIRERQREGIILAKAKGIYSGRKPGLNQEQISILKERHLLGIPIARIARDFGLTRQTLYKYLNLKTS